MKCKKNPKIPSLGAVQFKNLFLRAFETASFWYALCHCTMLVMANKWRYAERLIVSFLMEKRAAQFVQKDAPRKKQSPNSARSCVDARRKINHSEMRLSFQLTPSLIGHQAVVHFPLSSVYLNPETCCVRITEMETDELQANFNRNYGTSGEHATR